jgi:hypothetical protein
MDFKIYKGKAQHKAECDSQRYGINIAEAYDKEL